MRQLLFLILSCCFFACTNDEQDMKYGEEQVLNDTEWVSISEYYSSDKSLSPIEYPKNQTISFTGDSFTITTKTTVYDKDLQTTRYNPQNHLFVIPKRNVSVLRPFSKTKRLFLKQNQTAFKWTSNPI